MPHLSCTLGFHLHREDLLRRVPGEGFPRLALVSFEGEAELRARVLAVLGPMLEGFAQRHIARIEGVVERTTTRPYSYSRPARFTLEIPRVKPERLVPIGGISFTLKE